MNVVAQWLLVVNFFVFMHAVHAQNVHGVLRVVKGDVKVKTGKGEIVKGRIGGKVFPKDVVITGKDARAKIVMIDNNEINVSPETQIEIQHYEYDPNGGKKDVLLNVIYGKVRSKVEQKYDGNTSKFQIKTPSAVAGVRGTDFLMGFNRADRTSQVVTFEGKVEFGMPGPGGTIQNPVMVNPGQMALNNAGQPPTPPAPMPKEELTKVESESAAEPPKAPGAPAGGSGTDSSPAGDKKEGASSDDKKSGPATPAAENKGSASSGSRAPASQTGCTMCGAPPPPPPLPVVGGGPMPPTFMDPRAVLPNNSGTDQFIRDTIKGGQTNLIIKVKGQ